MKTAKKTWIQVQNREDGLWDDFIDAATLPEGEWTECLRNLVEAFPSWDFRWMTRTEQTTEDVWI